MNPMAPPASPPQAADPSQFGNYSDWAKTQMSAGMTPTQVHEKLASSGITIDPNQPLHPAHSGNWFTHLLPTIGGIGGGILGGLATFGLGGEIVGGGAGAAGGKALENLIEGKGGGDDVVKEGLMGAAGSAVGGIAGKALGKAGEFLGSRGAAITAGAAEKTAAKGVTDEALAAANATKNNFGGLSTRLQGDLKLGSNQKLLTELGYDATDPYAMRAASAAGHSKDGLSLNHIYDEALQGAKPINMSSFGNDTYKILQNSGTEDLAASPLGKVLSDFNGKTKGVYGNGATVDLPSDMSATDLRKLQQSVGKQLGKQKTLINNATNQGITNETAETSHTTLKQLYDDLGSKLKTPEVDKSIAGRVTSPEERASLVEKFGEKHGNQVADTIDQAQNADHLLKPMQQYTQMGRASDMAINDLENVTATGRNVSRVKADINGDGTADVAGSLPSTGDALHATVSGGGGVPGMALRGVYHAKDNPAILKTLSRIGALSSKLAPAAGVAAGTLPNLQADPLAASGGTANGTIGGTMNNGQPMQAGGGNDQQSYIDAIRTLSVLNPDRYGGMGNSVLGMTPMLQHNQLMGSELGAIPGAFDNAGGAQGTGGIMTRLAGLIPGTAAHTYQQQQAAAAQALAQQLGISPQAAAGLLPQLMQNQGTAGMNTGILGGLSGQLVH